MRGGKRDGAGRKKGARVKKTLAMMQAVAESGLTPLDYMLSVLRDAANDAHTRMDAAFKAAPYVHPRLSAVETKTPTDPAAPVSVVEPVVVDARKSEP